MGILNYLIILSPTAVPLIYLAKGITAKVIQVKMLYELFLKKKLHPQAKLTF